MLSRPSTVSVLFLLAALALASCAKLSPQQEHFQRGYDAFQKGDFASALLYLKPLVESGHPAAQLLMARMYSGGYGVEHDMGKAELLRNLAAFQIYGKKDLAPGVVRPANETLASISERLDYYVDQGQSHPGNAPSLPQTLDSVGVKDLGDLGKMEGFEDAQSVAIPIPHEAIPGQDPAAESPPSPNPLTRPAAGPPGPSRPAKDALLSAASRRSEQISLGVVRQAAEDGDPMAMDLLSAAYAQGFYGVSISTASSVHWREKAAAARRQRNYTPEIDSAGKVPVKQLWGILGAGILLIGLGALFRWRGR